MADQRREMEKWVRNALFSSREIGPCVKFAIKHVQNGKKMGDEVWTIEVPVDQHGKPSPDQRFCEDVVGDVGSAAQGDADAIGGPQTYALVAYFGGSLIDCKPIGRFTFRVFGEEVDEEGGSVTSEDASVKGHMTQMMRHNEALMRMSTGSAGKIIELQSGMIMKQADQIDRLQARVMENAKVTEDLLNQKLERDLIVKEYEGTQQRQEAMANKFLALMPIVASKIAPKLGAMIPKDANHKTAKDALLSTLLETIGPEQLAELQKTLSPDQLMLVMQLMQEYKKEEETAKKEAAFAKAGEGKNVS